MIKCNLCSFEIDENDDLINERKSRHEERHNGHLYKFQNIIRGNVVWLTEADQLMNNKISMKTQLMKKCICCLDEFPPNTANQKYCGDVCRRKYSYLIKRDQRKIDNQNRREIRHEKMLKTTGKITVGTGRRGNFSGRKRASATVGFGNMAKGMSRNYIALFTHRRLRLLLKMIENKPMTTHDVCKSNMIMKLDGTKIDNVKYMNQTICSNLLKELHDSNLIGRTVVQEERWIKLSHKRYSINSHTKAVYDVWLYHLPKLDTPYDKLMYLTMKDVFKRKGLRACKHVLL